MIIVYAAAASWRIRGVRRVAAWRRNEAERYRSEARRGENVLPSALLACRYARRNKENKLVRRNVKMPSWREIIIAGKPNEEEKTSGVRAIDSRNVGRFEAVEIGRES